MIDPDGPVLVYCECDHPRHGHEVKRRRHGGRSITGETWTTKERGACTMTMPDGTPCRCNRFRPKRSQL